MSEHLSGLTMRVNVIQELINILRRSGYPAYKVHGVNAPDQVTDRLKKRYLNVYGHIVFIPTAMSAAINVQPKSKLSLLHDKVETPAEPESTITEWDKCVRAPHIVAERST